MSCPYEQPWSVGMELLASTHGMPSEALPSSYPLVSLLHGAVGAKEQERLWHRVPNCTLTCMQHTTCCTHLMTYLMTWFRESGMSRRLMLFRPTCDTRWQAGDVDKKIP